MWTRLRNGVLGFIFQVLRLVCRLCIAYAIIWLFSKTAKRGKVSSSSPKPRPNASTPGPFQPPRFEKCNPTIRDASLAARALDFIFSSSEKGGILYYFVGNFPVHLCDPNTSRFAIEKLELVVDRSLLTNNMRGLRKISRLYPDQLVISGPQGRQYIIFEQANGFSPARAIEIAFFAAGNNEACPNFFIRRPTTLSGIHGQSRTVPSFEHVPLPDEFQQTVPVVNFSVQFKQRLLRYQVATTQGSTANQWEIGESLATDATCIRHILHRLALTHHRPFSLQEEYQLSNIMKSWIKFVDHIGDPITREEVEWCSRLGITLTEADLEGVIATG